ncbi:uncharacterized protein LOC141588261 [Silene latifolia]|uniref:uncharacterized protein LOC141588261 n=1 Tax=Silene latifolia TaxID=37657 RepID=UPI003D77EE5C
MGSCGFSNIRGMNGSDKQNEIKWFLKPNKDVTAQCIHAEVTNKSRRIKFWKIVVYGFNKVVERDSLFEKLKLYSVLISGPWMVYGDFNAIMAADERIGGANVTNAEMRHMMQTMLEFNLYDMKGCGSFYTWNNKHEYDGKVYSRIDRVFINEEWLNDFPCSYANFLPEGLFDHCPCLISFDELVERKKAPFKYFNMWAMADGYEDVIKLREGPLNEELCNAEKACARSGFPFKG